MAHNERQRPRRPRGVIILSLMLTSFGLVLALAGMVAPSPAIPAMAYAGGTLYFFILAWGLMKLRRWAWFATLIAMAIAGTELALTPVMTGRTALAPMAFLALGALYLLLPNVRTVFLSGGSNSR